MNKIVKLLLVFGLTLFALIGVVRAETTATATLNSDEELIKEGDTFSVNLLVSCDEGINVARFKNLIEYNEAKIEKIKVESADTANWDISEETEEGINYIAAVSKQISQEEKSNIKILKITFKLKDAAKAGDEISIKIPEIEVGTYLNNIVKISNVGYTFTVGEGGRGQEEGGDSITLVSIKIEKDPAKVEYTEGDKVDLSGIKVIAKYSDGTSKEVTNYTYAPNGELTKNDKNVVISYKEGDVTKTANVEITVAEKTKEGNNSDKNNGENKPTEGKDSSTSKDGKYPNTGVTTLALPMLVVILLAGASYIAYKKYKQI